MTDINNNNSGLWEANNIQNQIQSAYNQAEIAGVLQSYLDNPAMVMALVNDARTPPMIIQQIALDQSNSKAQILAITRIMNDQNMAYSSDVFDKILALCDIDDEKFWRCLPEIFNIVLKWKNTPLETIDFIFQALKNNRPTKLWLANADQVIEILHMILESWNENITSWFLSSIEKEITHIKSLSAQRKELKASKVQKIYTSSGNWVEKDPVGRINYTHGNAYWKAK